MKNIKELLVIFTIHSLCISYGWAQEIHVKDFAKRSNPGYRMGTSVNVNGDTLNCDSKSLLLNGEPFVPVMGEFHYARYNPEEWKMELLKMKAGGITIVSSYVFWIHHEEEMNVFDWSGSRDLNRFVNTCKEVGLPLVLRIGPFCHGEARHGGIPDWIVEGNYKIRSTDKAFLERTRILYANIYHQIKENFWKDGGPIIAVQFDNEHGGEWEYLQQLKEIALGIGYDVPLYTRTGWPQLSTPAVFGEIIPLYGDYSDGFWDRSLEDMPGEYSNAYIFKDSKLSTVIASEQFKTTMDEEPAYPYFTCELGGGMMPSYHRRIQIAPKDIYAMSLVKIGSGSNLPGYYMYHGGTNPTGKYHTMNEKQDSKYMNHNDLPAITYDFQTPLAQFGQINEHYHWLRRIHLFLKNFGKELSDMDLNLPKDAVTDGKAEDKLRWAIRSNGESGYVFVNNYQRLRTLSDKKNVRFTLHLPNETIRFPQKAITVPSNEAFYFPFNLSFENLTIRYATAQPIAQMHHKGITTLFMAEVKGIPVELMFETGVTILSDVSYKKTKQGCLISNLQAGTSCHVDVRNKNGKLVRIVILDETSSLQCYQSELNGISYLLISKCGMSFSEEKEILMENWTDNEMSFSTYPDLPLGYQKELKNKGENGLFTCYELVAPTSDRPSIKLSVLQQASNPRKVQMGNKNVAEQPSDEAYIDKAKIWNMEGFDDLERPEDYFLKITYEGDVARVYADGKLVQDNFYNGQDMYVPVAQLKGKKVTLHILPLNKDYPIYFPQEIRTRLKEKGTLLDLIKTEFVERKRCRITVN